MKKSILLSVLLVLLIAPVSHADPIVDFDSVWWERKVFDSHFASKGATGQSDIVASVVIRDYETARTFGNTDVDLSSGPGAGSETWDYGGQRAPWDLSRYWFNTNLGWINPNEGVDRSAWEKTYGLAVNYTDFDPDYTTSHAITDGAFDSRLGMPILQGSSAPGVITWNSVIDADRYRVTVYNLRPDGLPDLSVMMYSSNFQTATSFAFPIPHPAYDIAIAIEAIDFLGDAPSSNDWLRRSQYIFYSPAPVPVPGAVLLLGSGLIGLLGIRRKLRKGQQ